MAKADLTVRVYPICEKLCTDMGLELVDVALEKENTGRYLRIYLDTPAGVTLDDCERFHRAVQPLVEDYDYDFLEVSSPGADRPLKNQRDFDKHLGEQIEVKLYKPRDGAKQFEGQLIGFADGVISLLTEAGEITFAQKETALVKPVIDLEGIDSVDLTE